MENYPPSLAYNSVFIDPNNFKFGTDTHVVRYYKPHQNLGQIDQNLPNHVFDDVICKPSIDISSIVVHKVSR